MEAFGLPTSFGRAAPANKNSEQSKPRQQNNHGGGRRGNQGARTSPYPAPGGNPLDEGAPVERFQGPPRGRGRGRGGGGGRGRGGGRVSRILIRSIAQGAYPDAFAFREETILAVHHLLIDLDFQRNRRKPEPRSTANHSSRTRGLVWNRKHSKLHRFYPS